jgi:hypothetical protein
MFRPGRVGRSKPKHRPRDTQVQDACARRPGNPARRGAVAQPLAVADSAIRADSRCVPDEQMIAGAAASHWPLAVNPDPVEETIMPANTRNRLAAFLLAPACIWTAGPAAAENSEPSTQALAESLPVPALEEERAFAFRRMNLVQAVVDSVKSAKSTKTAVANALAMLRTRVGWSSDTELPMEVLARFGPVAWH